MELTDSERETLRSARASGALHVRFDTGREVTYRSLAEIDRILASDSASQSGRTMVRRIGVYSDKGF